MQRASKSDLLNIAELVRSLRPDWPRHLVDAVLSGHFDRIALPDLVVACVRYAADSSNNDVRGMLWRGAHWRGLETQPGKADERVLCAVCMKPKDHCLNDRAGKFPADDPRADLHEFVPSGRDRMPVIR